MSGITCDGYRMNILTCCYCSSSHVSFALSTLAKMEKLGFQISFIASNRLMNALCVDDDRIREAAKMVMNLMLLLIEK